MLWLGVAGIALLIAAALATGAWRLVLRPACIKPGTMAPAKLGFKVSRPEDCSCVEGICEAFAGGFNAMIAGRSSRAWSQYSDGLPVFFRPFAEEGAAMGYPLRAIGRFSPHGFEESLVRRRPGYRYLHYVGLGFWHAMRDHAPARLERIVAQLDPLLGMLCWDGYGFKFGFFDYADESRWRPRLAALDGYAVHAAYQGLGRSLWFRFMDQPAELIEQIRSCGPYAGDVAAGAGLAVVFTTVDRPERGLEVLEQMPEGWHPDVLLGMCFAYKARSISDPDFFAHALDGYQDARRDAITAAIERCDGVESVIRRDGVRSDAYRRWRETLRMWLQEHIEYPFVRLEVRNLKASGHAFAPA
ncbi:MAG: DUF1702 family protein [Phycisphaerae bacterium]